MPQTTIADRFAAYQFRPVELGGGLTGYLRTDGQTSELVQTSDDPGRLPELADNVDVYTMAGDLRTDDVDAGDPMRATVANVLAALADPRDEYALLDLRIANGYGRAHAGHDYAQIGGRR